jgi:hypothetical protein
MVPVSNARFADARRRRVVPRALNVVQDLTSTNGNQALMVERAVKVCLHPFPKLPHQVRNSNTDKQVLDKTKTQSIYTLYFNFVASIYVSLFVAL